MHAVVPYSGILSRALNVAAKKYATNFHEYRVVAKINFAGTNLLMLTVSRKGEMTSVFRLDSCVRGYHIYGESWTAVFGEMLCTDRELHNVVDRYAVAVTKATIVTVKKNFYDHTCAL